ncbi:MAG: hypothetical protein KAX10_10060 [Candidatus Lokiarchaeota archaeon]|nr:hypothetical protein [Candidatus Lokiarchaeota archaeon]
MLLMPPDLDLLLGGWIIFIVVFFVLWFIISIALAVWVYKDAEKRDMGGAVWLIIVILTGCIGCIIYLIVRK